MSNVEDKNVVFEEAGTRPHVTAYIKRPAFHVGDKVKLLNTDGTREGPFLIASVLSSGKVTLCEEKTGKAVKDGREIEVDYVEAA